MSEIEVRAHMNQKKVEATRMKSDEYLGKI